MPPSALIFFFHSALTTFTPLPALRHPRRRLVQLTGKGHVNERFGVDSVMALRHFSPGAAAFYMIMQTVNGGPWSWWGPTMLGALFCCWLRAFALSCLNLHPFGWQ